MIRFVIYNKYKNIENWLREQLLLYSPFQNLENSKIRTNVTWHDAYCQQHDDILRFNIFSTTKCHIQIQKKWMI
jgi:hypothetical protein